MSRFFKGCLVVVLILLVVGSAAGFVLGRNVIQSSFPQVSGEVQIPGLDGAVEVVRDAYGIPHIYASTQHDLFLAQGYVHAQDRFWQMDFWRHISHGRLGEMFGEGQLEQDAFLRTLGWARVAQEELDSMDATSREILDAYAQGVNAYLADHQGAELSAEYAVLGLMNTGYAPEVWQPVHSVAWAKVMAWDLGGNMGTEITNARLLNHLTEEEIQKIIPPYPSERPVIVPEMSTGFAPGEVASYPEIPSAVYPALAHLSSQIEQLRSLTGPAGTGIGSNNWVISGNLTASGNPILANDPHLGVQMPSIWYEVGLHCMPKSKACPYEVTGFSFAGAPGVIIGHNDRIAWGFTNTGPDVQDLFIEKINPDNPNQYEFQGEWVDMQVVQETLVAPGVEPQELTIRYTHHGPIISDVYGPLEDFSIEAGIPLPETYAIALSWTALEPGSVFSAIWQFNRAQNWEEFRAAAEAFGVPAQNLVYADVEGNIGYQMPGRIPIRAQGDGMLPVPGWTGEYEWTGFIPFDELPRVFNPEKGFVVTANNRVVGPNYPYLIAVTSAYGFRASRIVEMIESTGGQITLEDVQRMQADNKNLMAEAVVPYLLSLQLDEERLENARALLDGWDFQSHMDSAPTALWEATWRYLLAETFQDDLPEYAWPGGGDRWGTVVIDLLDEPDSPWWDDRETAEVEGRDATLKLALAGAVDDLEKELGRDPQKWAWGDLHTIRFENATLGQSGIPPIEALFNRGPYRTSGGSDLVNATGWNAVTGYSVRSVPSMRMIVDLGNLQNSLAVNTLGQSGHANHPHYNDMVDLWRTIQYHPMNWDRSAFEGQAEGVLRLIP